MINQYHANNPKITNGIETPNIYPLVVVVFVLLLVLLVLLVVLFVELLLPVHETHLDDDSLHV